MTFGVKSVAFRVITKCGTFSACPTVLESSDTSELVIVGKLDANVLNSLDVQKHTGEGEIAVVVPKTLILQAAKALS